MIFRRAELRGAYIIELEKREDERGFFARSFCKNEFESHGLNTGFVQSNVSYNKKKGTIRGMHYQSAPYEEAKLIRCTRGALYDVLIDLNPDSPTYLKWIGVELTQTNYTMVYVPEGFAHGFQTLVDHTEAIYQVSQFYTPGHERGIRYNDSHFAIGWPLKVEVVSKKDESWPNFLR